MTDKKISELTAATTPLAGTEIVPIVQSSTTKQVSVANLTAGRSVAVGATTSVVRTFSVGGSVAFERFGATPLVEMLGGTNSTVGYSYRININQSNFTLTNAVIGSGQGNILSIDNATKDVAVSSGNLVIGTAGKGIDFSANTNAAGMTSELLNWYEEGAFTPTVRGTTTVGTATYATQSGTYTRIGRMVYFQLELSWSGGTGAGQLRLGGLPFTCGNSNCAVSIGDVESVALTASYYMAGAYVFANSTQISLRECQVGGGGNNPVNYDDAGTIRVGGCYYV